MQHSSMPWEITMRDNSSVLFQLKLIWFLQKESIKVQNFTLSTGQVKFYQICTLIGSFRWKYIKFQLKKCRGVMSMMQNLKKNQLVSKMTRILVILIRALKSLQNLYFDRSLSCKVYNVWPKKVQSSYLSWHWRVRQNLKKNWLVVRKITWGIWQFFTRTQESLKIRTFIGTFYPKQKLHELKIYRGVMLWQ